MTKILLKLIGHNNTLGDVDFFTDATWGSDNELSIQDNKDIFAVNQSNGNSGDEGKCIVLHPTRSAYATRYPKFNTFAGKPLIDNGYVDNNNNQCLAMIVHPGNPSESPTAIDYQNTLFTVHGIVMEE